MKTQCLAGHLTKADEKALYQEILQDCPEGYVKDILQDMQIEVNHAIDSDFGFVSLAQRRQESESHREEMTITQTKLTAMRQEIAEKVRLISRANIEIGKLRDTFEEIAQTANQGARIK